MDILIGISLALAISLLARIVGFDRERSFYPVVMIVIASYYGLFAVMSGSQQAFIAEAIPMTAFMLAAIIGFRKNLWIVVAALAGHGVFDFFHDGLIQNPGAPTWWPTFCGAYDIVAAGFLAYLLKRGQPPAVA
ncbi:hypothetical protein [Stenotrophobium rhamnosiphilum]|uniref:Uncharacterized protein n=1 Tax=Stenotrophobium rhamnosiphilum TaxID=2029166 RepID=A0A2T5MIM1_9GAMM|nr:hypothetical protein [Stenotrophobium rhamnosiphilum]PTU32389.1 hypothetical protein CJD38_06995 [Stenotrophobium rhamnosiphilum]